MGKRVAIIDAKCMSGNKELEETSQGQMPDSKIVNQMIIAMDYGKPEDSCRFRNSFVCR